MEIYVKNTSNCSGMPVTSFKVLSPSWHGESLSIPFGEGEERKVHEVVGWTDLFFGSACEVHCTKVESQGMIGYLVHGGNSGVRILNEQAHAIPGVDDHLPNGYGRPIIWIAEEDAGDLPTEVQMLVNPQ